MKILVLVSGGDAPAINAFLSQLNKKIKNVDAVEGGYKGLINGNIKPLESFNPQKYQNQSGAVIKSSRCPEFKEDKNFNKALKVAKNYDCLVILGGNGSYKGAERLFENGVRTIFVPTTIDNDVDGSDYSLGFHSAVKACCFCIENIMPSMEAFNRCCVFEVMGRKCDAIAKAVATITQADYIVANQNDVDYNKISKVIKSRLKENHSSFIILRENIIDVNEFCAKLQEKSGVIVKNNIIGHIQRGFKPTGVDLKFAKKFANVAVKAIKKTHNSYAIKMNDGKINVHLI